MAPSHSKDEKKILMVLPEIDDAHVLKRVTLYRRCSFSVTCAAFDRGRGKIRDSILKQGATWTNLGKLRDRAYVLRIASMIRAVFVLWRIDFGKFDVIVARNLDNLVIAWATLFLRRAAKPIVYEVADLRPVITRSGILGVVMRKVERTLLERIDLLIVTSPGFIRGYFQPIQKYAGPVLVLENKMASGCELLPRGSCRADLGERIRIGYFGVIRCARSLKILRELVATYPDRLEVVVYGRVVEECAGLFAECLKVPGFRFHGEFRNPEDLPRMFSEIDCCWNIHFAHADAFEANARWNLTNRIYEAAYFGVPQVALGGTENGRYVEENGLGWAVTEPFEKETLAFFGALTLRKLTDRREVLISKDRTWLLAESDEVLLRKSVARLTAAHDDRS